MTRLTFGKCLYALIKKRGHSLRGYGLTIGTDSGNLCKLVNDKMNPPVSRSHVWRIIGALSPTKEEADELILLAYNAAAEQLKIKENVK